MIKLNVCIMIELKEIKKILIVGGYSSSTVKTSLFKSCPKVCFVLSGKIFG